MKRVYIEPGRLSSWKGFHEAFAEAFNFPSYYRHNLNAWLDCMWDATEDPIIIDLGDCRSLNRRKPEIVTFLKEAIESLNQDDVKNGIQPRFDLQWKL